MSTVENEEMNRYGIEGALQEKWNVLEKTCTQATEIKYDMIKQQ